jgi:hypothetical protein
MEIEREIEIEIEIEIWFSLLTAQGLELRDGPAVRCDRPDCGTASRRGSSCIYMYVAQRE